MCENGAGLAHVYYTRYVSGTGGRAGRLLFYPPGPRERGLAGTGDTSAHATAHKDTVTAQCTTSAQTTVLGDGGRDKEATKDLERGRGRVSPVLRTPDRPRVSVRRERTIGSLRVKTIGSLRVKITTG